MPGASRINICAYIITLGEASQRLSGTLNVNNRIGINTCPRKKLLAIEFGGERNSKQRSGEPSASLSNTLHQLGQPSVAVDTTGVFPGQTRIATYSLLSVREDCVRIFEGM